MKVSYVTLIAPLLAALAIAAPAQTYPGCDAATNAAAIGDTTALNNAVKACAAAGNAANAAGNAAGGEKSDTEPASNGSSYSSAAGYSPTLWTANGGCYECGPATLPYYNPGCHCENCAAITCSS